MTAAKPRRPSRAPDSVWAPKEFRLPHALVVCVALVVLGTLAFFGKETAAVVMGALALLGAFGFVARQQSEIKEHTAAIRQQTNGGYTKLLELLASKDQEWAAVVASKDRDLKAMAAKLAEMQPVPVAPPSDTERAP